eukprot:315090-Rhodomonas_salina.3
MFYSALSGTCMYLYAREGCWYAGFSLLGSDIGVGWRRGYKCSWLPATFSYGSVPPYALPTPCPVLAQHMVQVLHPPYAPLRRFRY